MDYYNRTKLTPSSEFGEFGGLPVSFRVHIFYFYSFVLKVQCSNKLKRVKANLAVTCLMWSHLKILIILSLFSMLKLLITTTTTTKKKRTPPTEEVTYWEVARSSFDRVDHHPHASRLDDATQPAVRIKDLLLNSSGWWYRRSVFPEDDTVISRKSFCLRSFKNLRYECREY